MKLRLPYRAILTLGLAALALAAIPGRVSAHTPVVSRSQAAPVFVFPANGQSFPLNGTMLFQVQPMSGAKGYLWSFVQGGAIMYQNLAWTGHLDGATYTVRKGSEAQRRLHGRPMQVWVRALMGNGRWSETGSVTVQLQGGTSSPKHGPTPTPKATHPAPGMVLYAADNTGGLDKLTGSPDWQHLNGMLINDGSSKGGFNLDPSGQTSWLPLPVQIHGTNDYALEVQAQLVNPPGECAAETCNRFGFHVRQSGDNFISAEVDYTCCEQGPEADLYASRNELAHQPFDPKSDWHTYRIEVRGGNLRFLIDGSPLVTAQDYRVLSGSQTGLFDNNVQMTIRSIKVIAL